MLKQKYVQQKPDGKYVVILPGVLEGMRSRTLGVYPTLDDAITARNTALGSDPDKPPEVRFPVICTAPIADTAMFGVLGDTHLGDVNERMDVLNDLYAWYERNPIRAVFHTGNIVTGASQKTRTTTKIWGMDAQADYTIKNYPVVAGVTTYFIGAVDHEGWWWNDTGIEFGRVLEDRARAAGRFDLVYLGMVDVMVEIVVGGIPVKIRVSHPGKGSAYAVSNRPQKILDISRPDQRPDLWLLGHYHKAEFLPDYKGVALLQTGCTVDTGFWAATQPLDYHIGGWLVEVSTRVGGRPIIGATYRAYEPGNTKESSPVAPRRIGL